MPRSLALALIGFMAFSGCDSAPPPATTEAPPASDPPPAMAAAEKELDAEDPTLLRRPFTADQIRDEWIPGLVILMRTQSMEGVTLERWTVVAADADGADIEFAPVNAGGNAAGPARTGRSTWLDLRNHASFPADHATREEVTRDTDLGQLDGWLYRVHDMAADTVTEFFFAESLPGAPVQMRVVRAGTAVMELVQLERRRPE